MTIVEPMTMITDYLLGAVCLGLGVHLLVGRRLVAAGLALLGTASAAFIGGAYHGLGAILSESTLALLWRVTLASIGVSNFFLVVAVLNITLGGKHRRVWIAIAAVQLTLYLLWTAWHQDFRVAIYDYAAGMAAVLGFSAVGAGCGRGVFARWMAAGVFVSMAASAVQMGHVVLSAGFNHNDLYHVIQIGAVTLFHQAFVRAPAVYNSAG
jgi:hypothetical protein